MKKISLTDNQVREFIELSEKISELKKEIKRMEKSRDPIEKALIQEMQETGELVKEIGDIILHVVDVSRPRPAYQKVIDAIIPKVNDKLRKFIADEIERNTTRKPNLRLKIKRTSASHEVLSATIESKLSEDENKKRLSLWKSLNAFLRKVLDGLKKIFKK